MRFITLALVAAATAVTNAQRPNEIPICDFYTKALLKDNTAKNQATLLTLLVNTVIMGNYTLPNVGVKVPGILAPGEVNGEKVNLLPYFNGDFASTNTGGQHGESVNFLDDGGVEPLRKNLPANTQSSRQFFLLNHLYKFFGSLLGCSQQGMPGFNAYDGDASMYETHKFMDLSEAEVTWFIENVGWAAASFGVSKDDVTIVGNALTSTFGMRCTPPTTVIKSQGPQLQAICIAEDCSKATSNATCSDYAKVVEPLLKNGSAMPTTVSAPSSSATSTSSPTSVPTSGAAANGLGFAAVVAGIAAFAL